MPKVCNIFLLAENRLLREALIRVLNKTKGIRVTAAMGYSVGVYEQVIAGHPNIILLDSNGLSFSNATFIPNLRRAIHGLLVVMVDMEADENTFLIAVRTGVVGYVLKDASAAEVIATIRAVRTGQAVCPPSLSMFCFRRLAEQQGVSLPRYCGTGLGLSRREAQLVELLRERLTNKEIATRLNLSEQTIKNHVHHILRKVGASNRLGIIELCENRLSHNSSVGLPVSPESIAEVT